MYQVRIKDSNLYPYDMAADDYFAKHGDDIADDYNTYSKAKAFCKFINESDANIYAYIWED